MREVLKKLVAVSDGTITRDSFEVTKSGLSVRRKKPEQGEEAEEGDSGDGEDGKEGEDGEDQQ